uniref:Uncharacterized protein n=1 Tax=Diaporthe sp. TaxID=1756133 RepID=A0A8K1ZRA9_9PEZI|nr:hypothetical protein [Diaporthe sp.]
MKRSENLSDAQGYSLEKIEGGGILLKYTSCSLHQPWWKTARVIRRRCHEASFTRMPPLSLQADQKEGILITPPYLTSLFIPRLRWGEELGGFTRRRNHRIIPYSIPWSRGWAQDPWFTAEGQDRSIFGRDELEKVDLPP